MSNGEDTELYYLKFMEITFGENVWENWAFEIDTTSNPI